MTDKKLLIFDLDGTLIDSIPDLTLAINYMLKSIGKESFSEDMIREWVGNGAKTLVQRALGGKEDVTKELEIFLNYYEKNLSKKTTLYPDVKEVLAKLKDAGYKLSIATNKPFKFISPILKALDIDSCFDMIVGADSLKEKKPHPMPLLHIVKELGFKIDEAVMIGDSKNDILSAKSANITSIAVSYGYNYGEDISLYKPDFTIENFKELLSLLKKPKVAIIGGGIAGSTASLLLANSGADVTLFEERDSLISGPPFCHLHSGGNLYPDIAIKEKLKLLKQSIELLRLYPHSIDIRPTVITLPKRYHKEPSEILSQLKLLQEYYEELVKKDPKNKVLGEPKEYYKIYEKEDLKDISKLDKWMRAFVKYVDISKLKFPIIVVQEYGINIFRVSSLINSYIEKNSSIKLRLNTKVQSIEPLKDGYLVNGKKFDYIINSAGYQTGVIDDMLGFKRERFVEFKAAYITKCDEFNEFLPEIIFLGERGTPEGMGQFTPYPNNHYQIHGMTKDITLFDECLSKTDSNSSQPKLPKKFENILQKGWSKELVEKRTKNSIEHISYFIPLFKNAKVASKPLYGAQQIPGEDPELRAYEVSFEKEKRYARCEIVKASSVIDMSREIIKDINSYGYGLKFENFSIETKENIDNLSQELSTQREYPKDLGLLNFSIINK